MYRFPCFWRVRINSTEELFNHVENFSWGNFYLKNRGKFTLHYCRGHIELCRAPDRGSERRGVWSFWENADHFQNSLSTYKKSICVYRSGNRAMWPKVGPPKQRFKVLKWLGISGEKMPSHKSIHWDLKILRFRLCRNSTLTRAGSEELLPFTRHLSTKLLHWASRAIFVYHTEFRN